MSSMGKTVVVAGKIMGFVCGLLTAAFLSSPAAAAPMTFFMETSAESRFFTMTQGGVFRIYASGEITEGTTERMLAFVRDQKVEAAKIHFDSPGGSLLEGMKLGRAIRALGFQTTVGVYNPKYVDGANSHSICASACAYAFAGGVSRFLDEYSGALGIHQFYSAVGNVSGESVQQVSGIIVAYLDEMGVDAKAFTLSTRADRDGMIWLNPELALRLRFANNGVAPPVAEIRLAGMRPYLRVEQEHHNVTTRVLFTCMDRRLSIGFGIVTDPETSQFIVAFPKRSYLELDHQEYLQVAGKVGAEANDSVVWLWRDLTAANLATITRASKVDGWVDGSGAVRWGAQLDMPTVREQIVDYGRKCFAG
jgi:hypothetical protein